MSEIQSHQSEQLDATAATYYTQLEQIRQQIATVIVGQQPMVEAILCAMLSRGHILLEGVPGLAKSLAVATFSRTIGGDYHRIQFTPDKLPSDVTGTMVYDESQSTFVFHAGPVFCNILLADEINRASPKVQSALLEAMQEQAVSVDSDNYPLPELFMVLATQNPVEQLGTYPLSEAQLDRFMAKITITYPQSHHEAALLTSRGQGIQAGDQSLEKILQPEQAVFIQDYVANNVSLTKEVIHYILTICQRTRPENSTAPSMVSCYVQVGNSPRAAEHLVAYCKSYAFLQRRNYVSFDDVDACIVPVLGHRLILSDAAILEGVCESDILQAVVATVSPFAVADVIDHSNHSRGL
ncbi:MAG: AAA family ATPase [Deltaproteobacteria bacterium]|nr:AAA family ATPase [Deltaproteobacteria bacterium]